MLPKLYLPHTDGSNLKLEIEHNGSVVIVGANGAGKSRLGAWIERNSGSDTDLVHRISAQRALDIPEYAEVKTLEQATNNLLWGHDSPEYAKKHYQADFKWSGKPTTSLQNDYQKVLSALFATSAERDRNHAEETKKLEEYIPVKDSPIDILINIWDEIFPHRQIKLQDGKVRAFDQAGTEYHGMEMSDGERVALYLMGQCLVAPSGSTFVVDEPEIHLHTSIMQALWNKLEEAKKDCLFVYITHDLGFASTRVGSKNIWVKKFDGINYWHWNFMPEIDEFPESLLLELMGNRRTIVFVEGEKGGKDHIIYQAIFPNYHVVPRNGCQQVIDSAKAMALNNSFHHVKVFGIIDRDYRTEKEIEALRKLNIHAIEVAEIENILLNESILRIVAKNQSMNPEEAIQKSLNIAKNLLNEDMERQVSLRTCKVVGNKLIRIDNRAIGLESIKSTVNQATSNLDIESIYKVNHQLYTDLLSSESLDDILKYFNHKGLLPKICSAFELEKMAMRT